METKEELMGTRSILIKNLIKKNDMINSMKKSRKFLDPEDNWNFDFMVEAVQVYGKELYYPANDRAELFLQLTGKKTYSKDELKILQKVGYNVIFKTKTLEEI
tara:strand:+ start:193 stop:501 length:309 start_codon:yes stop_codon:yes gene_type:complete